METTKQQNDIKMTEHRNNENDNNNKSTDNRNNKQEYQQNK